MLVVAPLLMMLAAAPSADAIGAARKAFAGCLSAQVQPSLDKKVPLGDVRRDRA